VKTLALSFFAIILLSSCTVGPDFVRPDSPKVGQYTSGNEPKETALAQGKAQHFDSGYEVPRDWWRLFKAPKLDRIVDQALQNNPTVQAALATLRASQSNLRAGYGVFYPQANAGLNAFREKSNPRSFGVNVPSSIYTVYTLSGSVSYALDLFGGSRRALEGLKAQVDSQRYAASAAYLSLTSNVVNTIIAHATYEAQIKATRAIIGLLKEQLSVIAAQVKASTVPYSNLLTIQSQLSEVEASLPSLFQKLNQTEHLLATLSGLTPSQWKPIDIQLADLTLPERLPKELPSRLASRRPDILMSEAQLHVSSAQVGVATAALYPNITLNGAFGTNAINPTQLFQGSSSFWNLGAGIIAPIFHGGQLRAEKQAAVEVYQASLADYRQTVLAAFEQVADSLRALEHDAELVNAETQAVASAKENYQLIQANYKTGVSTYLQLLIVNGQYDQARIAYLQAIGQRLQDTVALFAALGGGWWNPKR
jgi:NodT family efflux transporter outer membrane factor (OMF) lipoprotein